MSASQVNRLAQGGRIDRSQTLRFAFDGKRFEGYGGDTLASALLANGVRLVGRSFKYHRPRGIFSAGSEEPNALVELRTGARREPNTRATVIELFDGLEATSQHRWPSLGFDVGAVNSLIGRFIPAGFYYKTFMWPSWHLFEGAIRRAAGLGRAATEEDPDRYERRSAHCDVLVVGAGAAGLSAAKAAAEAGAEVILVDEMPEPGGRLLRERGGTGEPADAAWAARTSAELAALDNVRILTRTTAFGYYDHNLVACVERVADHMPEPPPHLPRQRLWRIRAKRVILATGAIEQPLVFGNNDRPGVMLAGAVRAYVNQYGVLPGRRAVLFVNNDDAYRTALDLVDAGATVEAVIDVREAVLDRRLADQVRDRGIRILHRHAVVDARGGRLGVEAVEAMPLGGGTASRIDCDLLCVSGGWAPAVHLHSQSGGKIVWSDDLECFLPGEAKQDTASVGAAAGLTSLEACLADGQACGADAAASCNTGGRWHRPAPIVGGQGVPRAQPRLWEMPDPPNRHVKKFVDIQDDVTADDVRLAHREGYRSVEHLKRYTTLGMGTDQGKTSNLNGHALMAALRNEPISQVGTTTFRPPYTPVTLGVLGGRAVRDHLQPLRRTPMDSWHADAGATWVNAGLWRRPRYYGRQGETMRDACNREVIATRDRVGLCDVSTLGKIDIQGPDAAEFLNRVYTNGWKTLPVGRARYGLMLREDGIVKDDGTTSRLGENHYVMTTTTANAAEVLAWLEFHLQAVWPELRVKVTSVTDQWAAMAIAGPRSRDVLAKVVDVDVSNEALPFMGVTECRAAGVPARLFRISFSGELAYELNVPSDYGRHVWEACLEAGAAFEIVPYGLEALDTMRIEKGHVTGAELDGRTTAEDLGLGRMVSGKKPFIGKGLLDREGLVDPNRKRLVGLIPVDRKTPLRGGAQIVADPDAPPPVPMLGHVTSAAYSPKLGHPIALALLSGGAEREGQTLHVVDPVRGGTKVAVTVTSPVFFDPEGKRLHA